ncbi:DMT family transporter [Paracoccus seriniphilus]|uniref:Guanidinium exporter n=1 Tax=Paracoccus seriniphilus TaxID=184748 RepID=A0A239PLT6_9RHOB|nr:multidrug efflux SMR transporter [Paracoccus seriniphilus]WCR13658.1 multidrug efflux SMR transporter [Paracoccus seriniphilus]SNT68746.1 quaternary ammonium compound-resistance protein SugE [Paracoccus seriniphilus]
MPWLMLFVAGLLEVVWATAMKQSAGFSRPWPTAVMVIGMIGSFWLLAAAMRQLPLGTAYMVWTGIGAIGSFILGVVMFGDALTPARMAAAGLIVSGILVMKIAG